MRRRAGFNPKRRLVAADAWPAAHRTALIERLAYGGNPEHKTRPNDYGLSPPTNPRPGKTLCDVRAPFPKREAYGLLASGVLRCMVSERASDGVPQNVWAVSEDGTAYEAQLENVMQCTYHGYPMPSDDDFRTVILLQWNLRCPPLR